MLVRRLISQHLAYSNAHYREPNYAQILEETLSCETLRQHCAAAKKNAVGLIKKTSRRHSQFHSQLIFLLASNE